MRRLALALPKLKADILTASLSRLAQLNGSPHAKRFHEDLGFNWRRLVGGQSKQNQRLTYPAGYDSPELLKLAVRKANGKTRMIGSEPIISRPPSFEVLKVGQKCTRNAISTEGYMLLGLPVFWQLAPVKGCEIHGRRLVALPPPDASRCKFDIAGRN